MTPESTLEISTKSSDGVETALGPVVKLRPRAQSEHADSIKDSI
jgi:hypothetical protein